MRILALTPRLFAPADTGGRIRSWKTFEGLSRRHELTLVCFRTPDESDEQVAQVRRCCARLETVPWQDTPKRGAGFYGDIARSLFDALPYTVAKYRSRAMADRLRQLLGAEPYDLLVCDFLQPSINCLVLPFRPTLLFQHNVETVVRQRLADATDTLPAKTLFRLEAAKLARYERRAAHAFDHCVMVSDEDCRTMAQLHGVSHTSSIPMGVDLDYFAPRDRATTPSVVFVGSMDMLANQDAMRFFVGDVLPLIRREVPVPLTIVGRNPPPAIARLAETAGVTVTGTVDDVRPYLAASQVLVVPLRIGGGTRLKIFEALAMGTPVVSTPVGAEGLPVTDGADIVLAASAEKFAAAVLRLLRSPGERQRLAEAGRRLASSHSWDAAAARFSEICAMVVDRHRSGSSEAASEAVRRL